MDRTLILGVNEMLHRLYLFFQMQSAELANSCLVFVQHKHKIYSCHFSVIVSPHCSLMPYDIIMKLFWDKDCLLPTPAMTSDLSCLQLMSTNRTLISD